VAEIPAHLTRATQADVDPDLEPAATDGPPRSFQRKPSIYIVCAGEKA
jgi:hypothetical protein